MSALYPFEGRFLDRNGIRLHYLDEGAGNGPPVVMLHGNPSWSFYYRNLVLALRDTHRCIVPDHIGCGLSEKPSAHHNTTTACTAGSPISKRCSIIWASATARW